MGQRGADQLHLHPPPDVGDDVLQRLVQHLRPLPLQLLVLCTVAVPTLLQFVLPPTQQRKTPKWV